MKEQLRDAAKLQNKWGNINQRLPDDLMRLPRSSVLSAWAQAG